MKFTQKLITYTYFPQLGFRKRMSVIVRDPHGEILLLCKDVDNVIFERLSSEVEEWRYKTLEHLKEYGEVGLRTLALAYSKLNEESYLDWEASAFRCRSCFLLAYYCTLNSINRDENVNSFIEIYFCFI